MNLVACLYDEAIDAGFRSFGLMFDDQSSQSVEAKKRAPLVLGGLNTLNELFVEWTSPHFPAVNHYATLSTKLKDGKLTLGLIKARRERLKALKSTFTQALGISGTSTEALVLDRRDGST